MYQGNSIGRVFLLGTTICVMVMGPISTAVGAEEETEILKIIVGEPTFMSPVRYQNSAAVAASRTGTVAAFYPKPDSGMQYRISNDSGRTWGEERHFPPGYVGSMTVGRREGGVLVMLSTSPVEGGQPDQLKAKRIIFSDDFLTYEEGISAVSIPKVVMHTKWARFWPAISVGKIVQMANGDLLASLYGNLRGDDNWYRTMVLRSTNEGLNWQFHCSVAFSPDDPDPNLVGAYCGYCEPSLALLSNGQL